MESFKQKRANLLNDNPIASHGSWISKHSIAAGSPLHQGGSYKQSPLDQIQGNNKGRYAGGFGGDGGDLLDGDGDGDTMFNDSNNDGTMASRALNSFNDFNRVAANAATDTIKKQLKGVANVAKSLIPSPMNQGTGDTAISDSNNDGNAVSRSLVAARNALDPSTKRALGNQNSSNQMFDYDSDGDTMFNDSNNDGTMLSRGLIAARNYLDPSAKQALGNKNSKRQLFDL
jgi:hypothetical protein